MLVTPEIFCFRKIAEFITTVSHFIVAWSLFHESPLRDVYLRFMNSRLMFFVIIYVSMSTDAKNNEIKTSRIFASPEQVGKGKRHNNYTKKHDTFKMSCFRLIFVIISIFRRFFWLSSITTYMTYDMAYISDHRLK